MTATVLWVRNPSRGKVHAVSGARGVRVAICGQRLDVAEYAPDSLDRCSRCVRETSAA